MAGLREGRKVTDILYMNLRFPGLLAIFFLAEVAIANFDVFDQIRARVNRSWYEAVVGKCDRNTQGEGVFAPKIQKYLQDNGYCKMGAPNGSRSIMDLSQELREKVFFDAVLTDLAIKNNCAYSSLSKLSVDPGKFDTSFRRANSELLSWNSQVRGNVQTEPLFRSETELRDAREAQGRIVSTYVDLAIRAAGLQIEVDRIMAARPTQRDRERALLLEKEIEIIRRSVPMAERPAAVDFFNQILSRARFHGAGGRPVDKDRLIKIYSGSGPEGFQKAVVEKTLEQIVDRQKALASTRGQYQNQHDFKTKAFSEGHAHNFLFGMGDKSEFNGLFSGMHCELEAQYGIGSEISSLSNRLAAGVLTAGMGGGTLLVARMAQAGLVAKRTEAVASIVGGGVNGSIVAAELGHSVMTTCFKNSRGAPVYSSCDEDKRIQESGIKQSVEDDVSSTDCLISVATGALAGVGGLKQVMKAREALFESRLQQLGLYESYQAASKKLQSNQLPARYRDEIDREMRLALGSVNKDGAPNPKLLEALAQEDPDALYLMLKQINETGKESWTQKVRHWLERKKIPPEERIEIESCLIQPDSSKTTACLGISFPRPHLK